MSRIIIFGDSIAWGAFDTESGGWAHRLRQQYVAEYDDCEVYVLGITGNTSSDVLKRFECESEARNPDVVLFAIGINDSAIVKDKSWVSLEEFMQNINRLITRSHEVGYEVGFIGLTRVNEELTTPVQWDNNYHYENGLIKRYDERLKQICEKEEVLYCDVSTVIQNEELFDGLHPNAKGHEKLFKVIEKFVSENFL